MITKTRGIVLRSVRFGESSLIVDVLTKSSGRVSFMVHIPKTSKGKIKKQYFQPMTLLDFEYDFRQRSNLQRIKDVRVSLPYSSIPIDPAKSCISLFLSEFIYYATRNEQENPTLFTYISTSLEWLDNAYEDFANFHLVFMMRLGKFLGFHPFLEDFTPGCFFDLRNGCFTLSMPLHTDFLNAADAGHLYNLMRMNFDTMKLFKLSHDDRNRITEIVLRYYKLHLPNMPELQSFDILREVFAHEI
ncbi:DNA repair protein RecO [Prevotella pallens]|uniref:DNA repair protein RecO n=2 Tax=Prevotella pallens TaxID=60133 RepID=A0A379F3E5_9BACT|nr:DNA repair protein RecO [Prevotella pallens]RKW55146.1 MAG: DNA repair protein RecO [Prevotella sp.]EGQ21484.1 recombination protein O [Prevotella pallens ATCC 700821]MBF1451512.1 DNA repair protein RecO [Prevotella pallens]MBF1458191.1 DNA repair protein RecO [Prevotella pallens]MBF1460054.1 DNA repair protein RecO [Prevotella pallens]